MDADHDLPTALILPLGVSALLVRFSDHLSDAANRRAIAFAALLQSRAPAGVREIVPSLVSVAVHYDFRIIGFERLASEVRMLVPLAATEAPKGTLTDIAVHFNGPDIATICASLSLTSAQFVARHNAQPLRVLATGFAPGFIYCGFHHDDLVVPRRTDVRPSVPAGSVLFAAGQTAITATSIPTGWHLIGTTDFRNFDAAASPPLRLSAGDRIRFVAS